MTQAAIRASTTQLYSKGSSHLRFQAICMAASVSQCMVLQPHTQAGLCVEAQAENPRQGKGSKDLKYLVCLLSEQISRKHVHVWCLHHVGLFICSFIHACTHARIHSFTHSLTHSLKRLLRPTWGSYNCCYGLWCKQILGVGGDTWGMEGAADL